ncbi:MAG TPA: cohesin domain-containing protein, partial [Terriglobales bacterium]|nr:cohesin domain-containing protein [Terriglobales bacterium]
KPEVVVDIAVMQVNREKIRTLGINPPTSATVSLQPNVSTSTASPSTNPLSGGTGTGTAGTPGSISLNALGNLNATDFQVNISSATATALYSDNDSRILQQPEIRAVDGQKASLKIGERVPVATGSFQPGIGGVGINPLVNTQFQYLDVGVNIDITPHVHADGSVTLKVMMDVSNVAGNTNIGGIQQPIIGQRKIEHEIRLKEGEVNMLGGMFEHDDVRSLTGYPWLAQIPLLRYLFGQSNVDRRNSEIVFVLTPHIVRGQFITPMNERTIDVGTANSIDLRQANMTLPAAPAAPAQQSPAAAPAQPAGAPNPQPQAAGAATLSFDPPAVSQSVGKTFAVNVVLSPVQNLYSVPVQIAYNPNMLEVVNVSDGNLLSKDGQPVALVHRDDPSTGTLQVTATRPPNSGGVSGGGQVFTITFQAKAAGTSTLNIARDGLRDSSMQPIAASGAQATVTVQ